MSAENVIGLHGRLVLEAQPPNEDLIRRVESLLEKARSGEVQGMAGAYLYRDGSTGSLNVGVHSYGLFGRALACLNLASQQLDAEP